LNISLVFGFQSGKTRLIASTLSSDSSSGELQTPEVEKSEIKLEEKIGGGCFGNVFKVRLIESPRSFLPVTSPRLPYFSSLEPLALLGELVAPDVTVSPFLSPTSFLD